MGFDFNAEDVFKMAEQMERNGAKFYRNAAEAVSGSPNKELLLKLADMEDGHEKTFAAMRKELTANEKAETIFDPNGESAMYLKSFVESQVFFKKQIDPTSMKEILKEAITAEKDSIVFYLGIKNMVPENLGKNRIEDIIKEEMGHIRLLGTELAGLKK